MENSTNTDMILADDDVANWLARQADENAAYERWMAEQAEEQAERAYADWLADSDDWDADSPAARDAYDEHIDWLISEQEYRAEEGR